jgi:HlyD family secretion protein
MTALGKPLYKIADMEFLNLRAFVAGSQLAALELSKTYQVKIDGPNGEMLTYQAN